MKQYEWDSYFFDMISVIKKKSPCLRRKVGALIVRDRQILSTGYNGPPSKVSHCVMNEEDSPNVIAYENMKSMGFDVEYPKHTAACKRVTAGKDHSMCWAVHAEQNAIVQAAKHGVSISGATMYCNYYPCLTCAKMIVNAGIIEVVYQFSYPDDYSERIFTEAQIVLRQSKYCTMLTK